MLPLNSCWRLVGLLASLAETILFKLIAKNDCSVAQTGIYVLVQKQRGICVVS